MNLSSIPLGPLHIPVFGLFAAVGLVLAMLLSQRSARMVGLPPERIWNLGLFAILSAFVVSRLLLVATQPHVFLQHPMAILTLPSLTYAGVWITLLLVFGYVRLRRMPVLAVLDAAAPSAVTVWLFLAVGHFVEGTAAGMPTHVPWAVTTPGDTMLGPIHPTQFYAALAALILLASLPWVLVRRRLAGDAAAWAMLFGGLADFLIGMLRQPWETYGTTLLDPVQFVDLALVLIGGVLLALPRPAPRAKRLPAPVEATHAQ